jgi:hypothetical protein
MDLTANLSEVMSYPTCHVPLLRNSVKAFPWRYPTKYPGLSWRLRRCGMRFNRIANAALLKDHVIILQHQGLKTPTLTSGIFSTTVSS